MSVASVSRSSGPAPWESTAAAPRSSSSEATRISRASAARLVALALGDRQRWRGQRGGVAGARGGVEAEQEGADVVGQAQRRVGQRGRGVEVDHAGGAQRAAGVQRAPVGAGDRLHREGDRDRRLVVGEARVDLGGEAERTRSLLEGAEVEGVGDPGARAGRPCAPRGRRARATRGRGGGRRGARRSGVEVLDGEREECRRLASCQRRTRRCRGVAHGTVTSGAVSRRRAGSGARRRRRRRGSRGRPRRQRRRGRREGDGVSRDGASGGRARAAPGWGRHRTATSASATIWAGATGAATLAVDGVAGRGRPSIRSTSGRTVSACGSARAIGAARAGPCGAAERDAGTPAAAVPGSVKASRRRGPVRSAPSGRRLACCRPVTAGAGDRDGRSAGRLNWTVGCGSSRGGGGPARRRRPWPTGSAAGGAVGEAVRITIDASYSVESV